MIKKVHLENFKLFRSFTLELNPELNILVGNNETGKSSILEAIHLALTKKINGRSLEYELSAFLFNKDCVRDYLTKIAAGENPELPRIVVELYLEDRPELQQLRGTNNSERVDCVGVKVEVTFDEDYKDEYSRLLADPGQIKTIPAEYYRVHWYSFAHDAITRCPVGVSNIDATIIRLQSGTDYYLQNIIGSSLDAKERVALAVAYRKLKEQFSSEPSIKSLNASLTQTKGAITTKDLAIAVDVSQRANWESNLVPHLDDLPFQFVGKGEQSALKIMLALERKAVDSNVILIEEPENHLSFSSMNILISKIREKCEGKQIIIVTHSAYVLNKLGIEKMLLLHEGVTSSLRALTPGTQDYFKKLSGYDTLRLILARRAILVEGPSDELIVQKAYLVRHGKLPIEDGTDVINIRGLSFARFLEIAQQLRKPTAVVTDNDGDYQNNVVEKYKNFTGSAAIKICASTDNTKPTLEPQLANVNSLETLNEIFGTHHADLPSLLTYMEANKTECALRVFETAKEVRFPDYIFDAIS